MFSFFKKKKFLVDLLPGITDFHNHLLPGIDDGAKNLQESLQLIRAFNNIGISRFVATPHVMGEYYPNSPETINAALQQILSNGDEKLNITAAAEYMMDQPFYEILENDNILPVVGKNVLVEMSYFQAPINLNEILFKLQSNSFSPILAHPERYSYLYSSGLHKYHDLKSRGCRFQLNMLSLSNHYGKGIQKTAFQLIEANLIDYICSDVHREEHIEKIKQIQIPWKYVNSLEKIISNNKALFVN